MTMKKNFERLQRTAANFERLLTSPELERLFFKKYKTDGAQVRMHLEIHKDGFNEIATDLQRFAQARGVELGRSDDGTRPEVSEQKKTTLKQDFDVLFALLREMFEDVDALKKSKALFAEMQTDKEKKCHILFASFFEDVEFWLKYLQEYLQEIEQKRLHHE